MTGFVMEGFECNHCFLVGFLGVEQFSPSLSCLVQVHQRMCKRKQGNKLSVNSPGLICQRIPAFPWQKSANIG